VVGFAKTLREAFAFLARNLCVICSRVAAAHVRGSAGGDFFPFASLAFEIKLPFASLAFEIKFGHAAGARMIYLQMKVWKILTKSA
jgi:hypothetical protein